MKIEVSNGEIIDKITILHIKKDNIKDDSKLKNVLTELKELEPHLVSIGISVNHPLYKELFVVNKKIWDIEDEIRKKENSKEFDSRFIELARSIYVNNDKRCEIKRQINSLTDSFLMEEKSYEKYEVR